MLKLFKQLASLLFLVIPLFRQLWAITISKKVDFSWLSILRLNRHLYKITGDKNKCVPRKYVWSHQLRWLIFGVLLFGSVGTYAATESTHCAVASTNVPKYGINASDQLAGSLSFFSGYENFDCKNDAGDDRCEPYTSSSSFRSCYTRASTSVSSISFASCSTTTMRPGDSQYPYYFITVSSGEHACAFKVTDSSTITKTSFPLPSLSNSAPSIAVSNLSYTQGQNSGNPVVIDSVATASDTEENWNGGSLTIKITANGESGDELSIQSGSVGVSGSNIDDGGTVFATLSESSGTANDGIVTNGDTLTVNFNGNATNSRIQNLVRSIAYRTTSSTPSTSARTVTFTLSDDTVSSTYTSSVSVSAINADATLIPASGITEPIDLPTTANVEGSAVNLFDFTITDGGGGDALSTTVTQIVINTSGTGNFSKVTWRLNGSSASNVVGTYNAGANTITFNGLTLVIADGGSETYILNGFFNDNSAITDNSTYLFSVDGASDVTVTASGTQMAP